MTASVFDHPVLGGLFADTELAALFAAERTLADYLAVELALAEAQAAEGVIPAAAAAAIRQAAADFVPDLADLAAGTRQDGLAVPAFVRQLRAHVGPAAAPWLHVGSTSQDLIDTALTLALRDADALFLARLDGVLAALDDLAVRFGDRPLMARTRMQAALPVTVADRLRSWQAPLARARTALAEGAGDIAVLQVGGPVGDRRGMLDGGKIDRAEAVAARMAAALGLAPVPCWHTDRSRLLVHAGRLDRLAAALGKIGQDLCLMAQQGIDAAALAGGGGSSAMPHKQNPVLAETLVALARYAATQHAGLLQAQIHEQERSGAAWTLEWMLLPGLAMATGAALLQAAALLSQVERLGEAG